MSNFEASVKRLSKEIYSKICRYCNRPIAHRLTVINRDAEGYPACNECADVTLEHLPAYGCYVWLVDGTLFSVESGDFRKYGTADEVACEVTAPASQTFLDAVNRALGTDFRLDQFAGR